MTERLTDAELGAIFDHLDKNKDGRLGHAEIADLLRVGGIEPSAYEVNFIIQFIDTDKSGTISKDEFIAYLKAPPSHQVAIADLERQFQIFDVNRDGSITADELKKIMREMNDRLEEKVIEAMFRAADRNNDGRINFQEFVKMMNE